MTDSQLGRAILAGTSTEELIAALMARFSAAVFSGVERGKIMDPARTSRTYHEYVGGDAFEAVALASLLHERAQRTLRLQADSERQRSVARASEGSA